MTVEWLSQSNHNSNRVKNVHRVKSSFIHCWQKLPIWFDSERCFFVHWHTFKIVYYYYHKKCKSRHNANVGLLTHILVFEQFIHPNMVFFKFNINMSWFEFHVAFSFKGDKFSFYGDVRSYITWNQMKNLSGYTRENFNFVLHKSIIFASSLQ